MPIAVSGNFVWLQEGYFLSLHEQWPNIDGSIQLEAGKNSDINPGFTKKQKKQHNTPSRAIRMKGAMSEKATHCNNIPP